MVSLHAVCLIVVRELVGDPISNAAAVITSRNLFLRRQLEWREERTQS